LTSADSSLILGEEKAKSRRHSMTISESLLPEFDQEMANTRKTLERVPDDKLGWKPHAKSFTMGNLAQHIALMVGWTKETMTLDSFDYAPPGGQPYTPPPVTSAKDIIDTFDKGAAAARSAIVAATDQTWLQPWSLLAGGKVQFTMPRLAVLRSFVMNHTIHHRAQLGVYLRLNEIPVPSIYGPSADEGGM
jgi:uncharacterized damage-inducible protein DinB